MGRAMHGAHTLDGDDIAAGATHPRTHGIEAIGQIDHFRLACRVLDDGGAISQTGRHHQVFCTRHRHHVGDDTCATQARRARHDIALLDGDLRAHLGQALDVLIHRTQSDGATARQRHPRLATARQQWPQHQDGGTHGLDHVVRCQRLAQPMCTQFNAHAVMHRDLDPHATEQAQHGGDVHQMRHILQPQGIGTQQRRTHQRQRRVLGAGDTHLTLQAVSALNQQLIQAQSQACDWPVACASCGVRVRIDKA